MGIILLTVELLSHKMSYLQGYMACYILEEVFLHLTTVLLTCQM